MAPRSEVDPNPNLHVDLVVNDFSSLVQRRVAVLRQIQDLIDVEYLEEAAVVDLPEFMVHGCQSRQEAIDRYLSSLSTIFRGSVFVASAPHDAATCPYGHSDTVPFAHHPSDIGAENPLIVD